MAKLTRMKSEEYIKQSGTASKEIAIFIDDEEEEGIVAFTMYHEGLLILKWKSWLYVSLLNTIDKLLDNRIKLQMIELDESRCRMRIVTKNFFVDGEEIPTGIGKNVLLEWYGKVDDVDA